MVSMCPSSDGVTCTASGLAFDPGWLVYTYPAGAATANQAYKASNILLRATSAREGVSILALNSAVVSFGQQGQLVSSATSTPSLTFITCYRSGSSGAGVSSSAVPGVELTVNGSGSVISTTLAAAASCTPS